MEWAQVGVSVLINWDSDMSWFSFCFGDARTSISKTLIRLISTVPPGAHTFYNISARISRHFVFSLDEDSCINCGNVGKLLTCSYVFTASRAWLKFVYELVLFSISSSNIFILNASRLKQGNFPNTPHYAVMLWMHALFSKNWGRWRWNRSVGIPINNVESNRWNPDKQYAHYEFLHDIAWR